MGVVQPGTSPPGLANSRQGAKDVSGCRHRLRRPTGRIAKFFNHADRVLGHEDNTSTRPRARATSSPLGQEEFVFISMVVRPRSAPGISKSQLSPGLRAAKMDDNLSMERMKTIALLAATDPQLFPFGPRDKQARPNHAKRGLKADIEAVSHQGLWSR